MKYFDVIFYFIMTVVGLTTVYSHATDGIDAHLLATQGVATGVILALFLDAVLELKKK